MRLPTRARVLTQDLPCGRRESTDACHSGCKLFHDYRQAGAVAQSLVTVCFQIILVLDSLGIRKINF